MRIELPSRALELYTESHLRRQPMFSHQTRAADFQLFSEVNVASARPGANATGHIVIVYLLAGTVFGIVKGAGFGVESGWASIRIDFTETQRSKNPPPVVP
jgi:hypothetical protein